MRASWHRVALLLFTIGWGANHFGSLLLVYRVRLHLGPAAPAMLFGIYALGIIPAFLLSGPVSDRYGRRALVVPAAACSLAASLLLGVGGAHFAVLLIGRFCYGLAAGTVMGPGAVWLIELSSGEDARTRTGVGARRATIALSSGFALGPLISGLLAQYAPAPTLTPYLVHATALLTALLLVIAAPAPARPAPTRERAPLLRIGLDATNRRRFLLGAAIMAPFVFAFPSIAFAALPAIFGPRALGTAPIAFTGLLGCITMASAVLAQPLTRGATPTTGARIGITLGATGLALAALVVHLDRPEMLLFVSPLLGAGYGIAMTSGLRIVEQVARPDARGGLTGLYYTLAYLGFATPYLLALAASPAGAAGGLLVLAALALASACMLRAP